jgi:hypothetical protein
MRVLVIISILALAALLWASISTIQHIRRARQQDRERAAAEPVHDPSRDVPQI